MAPSTRELFFCKASTRETLHNQHLRKSNEKPQFKMGVFVPTETSAGFALFKAKDSKIFKKGDLSADVETAEGINGL